MVNRYDTYKEQAKNQSILIRDNAHKWFGIEDIHHAIMYHLNLSDSELVKRRKPFASTFHCKNHTQITDLLFFVIDEIENNFCEEIAEWMEDQQDHNPWILYIEKIPEGFTGRLCICHENKFIDCDATLVVLKKVNQRFVISTVFPYNTGYEPPLSENN